MKKLDFYNNFIAANPHDDPEDKLKSVRGSASAWLYDGKVMSDSNQGCPRVALLRSKQIQDPKDISSLLTFEVGFRWEEVFKAGMFGAHYPAWDTTVVVEGETVEGYKYSGRPDVVAGAPTGEITVFETKSISSQNKFDKVFTKDEIQDDYTAQLVFYMDKLKINKGFVAYGAFLWGAFGKSKPNVKLVSVDITPQGGILVNGKRYKYTVKNQNMHTSLLGWCINEEVVFDSRPLPLSEYKSKAGIPSACTYCVFSPVCDRHDKVKLTTQEFVSQCRDVIAEKQQEINRSLNEEM